MADKISILKTIKVLLGMEEEASPSYTLADGTPIQVSELTVGGTVLVGDAPAPLGEHTLSDGQVIVVDENGVITEIKPVALEQDPTPAEAPAEEPQAPQAAKIEEMVKEAVKEAVSEEMKAYKTGMAEQAKTKQALEKLAGLVEEILNTPLSESTPPKQTFTKTAPESKTEKYGRMLKNFQTIKN